MAVVLLLLVAEPALRFQPHRDARAELLGLAGDIAARDSHSRLLVISGPMYLYPLLNSHPPSPLLNSTHLISPLEDNVSHLDTAREVERILAWRPTVVVTAHDSPPSEENPRTAPLFKDYLRHCTFWFTRRFTDHMNTYLIDTYGCAEVARSPNPGRIGPAGRHAP